MPTLIRTKLDKDVWSRPCTKIKVELGIFSRELKRFYIDIEEDFIPAGEGGVRKAGICGTPNRR